jgi:ribosomal protein S18 acetylase RimI-like enzyme
MGALCQSTVLVMEVRPATWDDLPAATALLAEQSRAATGVGTVRLELVAAEWALSSFELGCDNWIGDSGYGAISPTGELVLAARDPSVADTILAHAIARGRERRLDTLTLNVLPGDRVLAAVVRRHRFELDQETLLMWRRLDREPPRPAWPEGIAVRTFEPEDASVVHDLLDSAYGAWDSRYVPIPHGDWVQLMTGDVEFDTAVWWLAEREGELVGCALHWSSGWLKDIAVRSTERGRGLGRALVLQGLGEFARRRVPRVGLKVDAANPTGAVELYEQLGFVTERPEATWRLSL